MSSLCVDDDHVMKSSSSSSSSLPAPGEQLCYVPCSFCNIILAVSVPCSRLLEMVTVRCGHCGKSCYVNMAALRHTSPSSVDHQQQQQQEEEEHYHHHLPSQDPLLFLKAAVAPASMIAPEKKQRVPSAYNRFMKEEIQRIKANNRDITHKEAFSTAAKNWAHFPHIRFCSILENNNQTKLLDEGSGKHGMAEAAIRHK